MACPASASTIIEARPTKVVKANRIMQKAMRMAQSSERLMAYSRVYSRHSRT